MYILSSTAIVIALLAATTAFASSPLAGLSPLPLYPRRHDAALSSALVVTLLRPAVEEDPPMEKGWI